ncbi:hypothetical protein C8R45DRAFT_1221589 [Mycena sanguinolenta]|nr:hypothetical protein C8R45DRAFT_1221589 [Mycena sanguinolenta]
MGARDVFEHDEEHHAHTSTNVPATLAALLGLDAAPVEDVVDDAALVVLPVVLTFAGAADAAEPDEPLPDVEDGSESGGLEPARRDDGDARDQRWEVGTSSPPTKSSQLDANVNAPISLAPSSNTRNARNAPTVDEKAVLQARGEI